RRTRRPPPASEAAAATEADMMMVDPRGDRLLLRTRQEVTEAYPYPMMPTHFLDRDPENARFKEGNFLNFNCAKCPRPTMRWGQAQPSWTYWALPFLGRWLAAKIDGREEMGVPTAGIQEDEDLLNVALWKEGATKAWCMWQKGGAEFVWLNYLKEHAPGPVPHYKD
ncbi:unnamed protein product, partial [Prorocentrum cordatum]